VKRWNAATAEILALVPTIGRYYLQTFIGGGGCAGCRSLAGSLRDRDISPDAKATAPPRPAGESAALALSVRSKEVRALVGRWDFWASVSLFSHWLPGPAGVWEAVLTGGDATADQKKRKLAGRAAVAVMLESALGGAPAQGSAKPPAKPLACPPPAAPTAPLPGTFKRFALD
jgi:hypothetical protein